MPSSLEYLLSRYADKTSTGAEKEELMELLQQAGNEEAVQQLIDKMLLERVAVHTLPDETAREVLQAIFEASEVPVIPVRRARVWRMQRWQIAAVVVLVVAVVAGWVWLNPVPKPRIANTKNLPALKTDVAPGGNKAVLTLANGTKIDLDDAANGTLAQQGSSVVNKAKDGQLVYHSAIGNHLSTEINYNTLSTPRGGQYQLTLPDGSKVWLNAASSITYPTTFTGNERKVQITGEAYFEIAHNSKMPFRVEKGELAVQVIGTHFNVNAYEDESAVNVTLLEGSVNVKYADDKQVIKPGQQAQVKAGSKMKLINEVDVEVVMAWKNGLFHFENSDIKEVMRQVSRWYDVDVVYKTATVKNDPLFIEVQRNTNLSDVLKVIGLTAGVQLKIEGRKIIVL